MQPWFKFRRLVGEDRKCRNAVFAIVLELIVTPNHAEIGLKLVEGAARHAKTVDHRLTVRVGMGLPVIGAPLAAHRLRPIIDHTQALRQRRIRQTHSDTAGQIPLDREAGIMRDAKPEYLSHGFLLASRPAVAALMT